MRPLVARLDDQDILSDSSSPTATAEAIGNNVTRMMAEVGVQDYTLGLSVRGNKYYLSRGQWCDGSEAAANPSSGFEMSCLFKPLMAAVTLALCETGKLRLEAPIAEILPELAGGPNGELIQIRHLISHTPGYAGFDFFPPIGVLQNKNAAYERIRHATQLFWPGTIFSYEHSVTALLGEILSRITGTPPGRYVRETVFDPLGVSTREMNSTPNASSDPGESGNSQPRKRPASGLSIVDLLTVVESLFQRDSIRAGSSLSVQVKELVCKPFVAIPRLPGSSAARYLPIGCGLGLETFRKGFFGYDGKTPKQVVGFRFSPDSQIAIALGIDKGVPALRRVLMGEILELLPDGDDGSAIPTCFELDPRLSVHEILGDYIADCSSSVSVRRAGADLRLVVQKWTAPRSTTEIPGKLERNGTLSFTIRHPGGEPTFFRYARTGEPCLMLGMCAFKKLPVYYAT